MKRAVLTGILVLTARIACGAFDLRVHPGTISVDDTATVRLSVEGFALDRTPDLEMPPGLSVVGTSTQSIIINGRRELVYEYQVAASKPGEYPIGPYVVKVNGQNRTVAAVRLTVTPAQVVRNDASTLVTLEAGSTNLYVQQPTDLTLTFLSENAIQDIELTDFNTEGLQVGEWRGMQTRDRFIDGKRYQVRRFHATAIPITAASFELDPTFKLDILLPSERVERSAFGMLIRRQQRKTLRIQADPITLVVREPPPEGRPEDFNGAIGTFALQATASPSQLQVGDPITLRVQLSGRGSMRNVLPPSLTDSQDFKVYEPKLIEDQLNEDGTSGRKTLEQVIIPRHQEVDRVPELAFSFFDPKTEAYRILRQGPFPLKVAPPPRGQAPVFGDINGGSTPAKATVFGEGLVYIKTRPGRLRDWPQSGWLSLGGWSAMPLVLWGLVTGWVGRQRRWASDPIALRRREASRQLKRELNRLREGPEGSSGQAEAAWHCLSEYLRDRLSLPAGEVDPATANRLLEDQVSEELRRELTQWFERCARARFAGSGQSLDLEGFEAFMRRLSQEVGA